MQLVLPGTHEVSDSDDRDIVTCVYEQMGMGCQETFCSICGQQCDAGDLNTVEMFEKLCAAYSKRDKQLCKALNCKKCHSLHILLQDQEMAGCSSG
jgi:hypothetical protein